MVKLFIVGIGGGFTVLILFSLLASVGDIVLAPSPEARPEANDCRLLPDEEGVCALSFRTFLAAVFVAVFDVGVAVTSFGSFGAVERLFTLFCLLCVVAVSVDTRGNSAPDTAAVGWIVVRLLLFDKLLFLASAGLRPPSEF